MYHANVLVRGHIESVDDARRLIEAIAADGLQIDHKTMSDPDEVRSELVWLTSCKSYSLVMTQVCEDRLEGLSETIAVCQDLSLPFSITWSDDCSLIWRPGMSQPLFRHEPDHSGTVSLEDLAAAVADGMDSVGRLLADNQVLHTTQVDQDGPVRGPTALTASPEVVAEMNDLTFGKGATP